MQILICSLLALLVITCTAYKTNTIAYRNFNIHKMSALSVNSPIKVGDTVPEGAIVDMVETGNGDSGECLIMNDPQDFGKLLKTLKKAIVFAVPGAFTPTCSAQHLPSFITHANEFYKNKGVTDIFCLSVNDKYVMKSWAEMTSGCVENKIKMVADGNAEYTKALGMIKDGTGSRMGLRSKRYAAVIENGIVTLMNVDEKGMKLSGAEAVLAAI